MKSADGRSLEERSHRRVNVAGVRQEGSFEAFRLGRDAVGGSYSADRRIEVIERFELDSGDDLVDVAADQDRLTRHDAAAGLSNRGEDRLNVERNQTAQETHVEGVVAAAPSLRNEAATPSVSKGASVRGSTTSTEMPSRVSNSPAARASGTVPDMATIVASVPSRTTRATPMGSRYSSSGTMPLVLYRPWLSTKRTGLFVRIADFSSPLASAGVAG